LARTSQKFLFFERPSDKFSNNLSSDLSRELSLHKIPRLGMVVWFELMIGCSNSKMKKLYKEGERRL
jgi:hypothetical protein